MRTLDWFREIGPLTATRFDNLFVWRQDRSLWRIVVVDDCGDAAVTGPPYVTRFETMCELASVDARYNH